MADPWQGNVPALPKRQAPLLGRDDELYGRGDVASSVSTTTQRAMGIIPKAMPGR